MTESNVYEGNLPAAESVRLASNSFVTRALDDLSVEAMGNIGRGDWVWDIGCGEHGGLQSRVLALKASYAGRDSRYVKDKRNVKYGTTATFGIQNVRHLTTSIVSWERIQIVHARNLLAHFERPLRLELIAKFKHIVTVGGRLVIIDEDWSGARGSNQVEALRDLLLSATYFNARYGRTLFSEVNSVVDPNVDRVFGLRHYFKNTCDYEPLLALAPVVIAGLRLQSKGDKDAEEHMVSNARRIFKKIRAESRRKNPPGYRWPDAVAVVTLK